MKKITKILLFIFLLLITLAIIALIINFTFENSDPTIEFQPNNTYAETLIVVADKDFDPYSFYDENGNPSGHDIEMIYLLADAMEMNVEIRLMEWNEAIKAIKNKEVDALLGLVYTPQELETFQLSIPICNDSFVVFGKKDYSGLNDLYGKKLAILKGSDIYTLFLEPYTLDKNTIVYNTYGEAFDSVENRHNDYVIATYSVGRRTSAHYKGIKPFGSALVSNSFCIAVSGDNTYLMNKINATILEKKSDGTLYSLSEKWLGKYVEIIGIGDFFKQHTVFFIILLSFTFLIPLLSLIYVYRRRLVLLKNNESILLERASQDYLTNLFNRSAAENIISQIISGSQVEAQHALFMIDIDNFKAINDTYGHDFGDQVLILVAIGIKNIFRNYDIVTRMGGDEFLVFMKDYKNIATVEHKASKLCSDLYKNNTIQDTTICISVSIGISICPRDGNGFATLYKTADKALYVAKEKGKNQFAIYSNT